MKAAKAATAAKAVRRSERARLRWLGAAVGVLGVAGCDGGSGPPPPLLKNVTAVTAGGSHACARLSDGTARCWGSDAFGELGDGTAAGALNPIPVAVALNGIVALGAGGSQTCAVVTDSTVSCWGNNIWGELGNGTRSIFNPTPAPVAGVANALAIAATGPSGRSSDLVLEYSCALVSGGKAFCWGNGGFGALGDGNYNEFVPTPVAVEGLEGATQLVTGGDHACALLVDHSVTCWGGALASTPPSATPTAVPGITNATALAAGATHTCALLVDGTVACWGSNLFGQLGTGQTSSDLPPTTPMPTPVPGLGGVTALAAGGDHTCALLGDGTVRCWGSNAVGELGDAPPTLAIATPTVVKGLAGAVAITCGVQFTCAVLGDGTARCWGANESGQLGGGSRSPDGVPTPVGVVADGPTKVRGST